MQNIDPASQLLVDNKKNVRTRARKSLIIRSGYPTYFLPVLVIPMSLVSGLYVLSTNLVLLILTCIIGLV